LCIGALSKYETLALIVILSMLVISFIVIFLFNDQILPVSVRGNASSSLIHCFLKSPSSILVIVTAGALASTMYSIFPYCLELMKFEHSYISMLLFVMVVGGSIFQYPIGYLADKTSKSKLLLGVFAAIAMLALLVIFLPNHKILYLLCFFLFGGLVFSIYPVGTNYICENFKDVNLLGLTKTLVLSYSIGCMIGPMIAPIFIFKLGAVGVFWFFSICSLVAFGVLFILKEKKL
jgi:predicted MFS family arabinose efflux permease